MFVLLLFTSSYALNLTDFENFEIELNADCPEYFIFQGKEDFVYFSQKNGQFELWVVQNASNNSYAFYTMPWTDNLKLEWPDKTINNKTMDLVLHDGPIEYPLNFYSEIMLCEVFWVTAGVLAMEASERPLFKCPMINNWLKDILITAIVVLFLILLGVKNESIRAILGPKVSGVLWWYQQILSRSQETASQGDSSSNSEVSKGAGSVHIAQTSSETQEISKDYNV